MRQLDTSEFIGYRFDGPPIAARLYLTNSAKRKRRKSLRSATDGALPKGDLWVQSPMIIIGQAPNIRSIAENRRRSTEAYRRVMSTWPSMMVDTAEGDLPKLFSPALLA